jgi:heterodisulfide reductase subunit C
MDVTNPQHSEAKKTTNDFSRQVATQFGGETMKRCYQCGTCASSCPVAKKTPRFNPRELIKLSLLGSEDEVLSSEAIWLCCSCYNCQERCPQKVEIADVIYALRNIALKKGHVPNIYSKFAAALMNEGRIVGVSKFVETKRPTLGLPALQKVGVENLRKILCATGFEKLPLKENEE